MQNQSSQLLSTSHLNNIYKGPGFQDDGRCSLLWALQLRHVDSFKFFINHKATGSPWVMWELSIYPNLYSSCSHSRLLVWWVQIHRCPPTKRLKWLSRIISLLIWGTVLSWHRLTNNACCHDTHWCLICRTVLAWHTSALPLHHLTLPQAILRRSCYTKPPCFSNR